MTGIISSIERCSTVDGPGIRTVVFLKGCPLRCVWCHNPETMRGQPEIVWQINRCTSCGICQAACPQHAVIRTGDSIKVNSILCAACGQCVSKCPQKALKIVGAKMTADDVLRVVAKDTVFYKNSGGGVTVSGGDPMFQPSFTLELLKRFRENTIHTALNTSCFTSWDVLEAALTYTDLLICDLKQMDPVLHQRYTGVAPNVIWENLKRADNMNIPIWLRIPMIPNHTDDEKNIERSADFVSKLKNVRRLELLKYNSMAACKYEAMGTQFQLRPASVPPFSRMEFMKELIQAKGVAQVVCIA